MTVALDPPGAGATEQTRFPAGSYFIAGSRLRPPLDGGYTISALRRAMQFRRYGGVEPVLLTFEFWPEEPDLDRWHAEGWIDFPIRERNLFRELRERPAALLAAASAAPAAFPAPAAPAAPAPAPASAAPAPAAPAAFPAPAGPLSSALDPFAPQSLAPRLQLLQEEAGELRVEHDAAGRPWRSIRHDAAGAPVSTDYLDSEGRPVLRVPYLQRADWHRAPIEIEVLDEAGQSVGVLDGFAGLYKAFVAHVLDTTPAGPAVVVCESKQVGELICVGGPRERFTLVHTVHSTHLAAPHEWDSPIDLAWTGWFERAEHFDAVLWLSRRQLDDARRRFSNLGASFVVPHPAEPLPLRPDPALRDPLRAIMVARLVPVKQVDHLVRAWAIVAERLPEARLDIHGDGPEEPRVRALIDELGLAGSIALRGYSSDAAEAAGTAALLAVTSKYEGQTLVMLEAAARACPVVAYDINYSCAEMIDQDASGLLVPKNDIAALAEAMLAILGSPEVVARYSDGAWDWAHRHDAVHSMALTAAALREVLGEAGGAAQ